MDSLFNNSWILYFHAKDKTKNYSDNTTFIINIKTIKDFWGTFNNFPKPTEMFSDGINIKRVKHTGETPNALSFFKENSYPSWEHESNINGFEWSIRKFKDLRDINSLWEKLLVCIVSENFEYSEIINGVRIVDCTIENKLMYRFEIWFNNKNYKDYYESKIKELLSLPQHTKMLYRDHSAVKET